MKLTKFSHSCVRLENEGKVLVLDPGNFSEVDEALDGADFLLITHAHPDHFHAEKVLPLIEANSELVIYAPAAVVETIKDAVPAAKVTEVEAETSFELDGFSIKTFGGQHALIHPLVKTIDNFGYLINDKVYHPGDSLVVPHGLKVEHALAPIHAPWNKMSEVIDFIIALGAKKVYPIHNGLINENGHGIIENQITNFAKKYGSEYQHLDARESIEL